MPQQNEAEDFVLTTGGTHTVREFVELSFKEVAIDIEWKGHGVDEKGLNASNGNVLVEIDSKYFRPTEAELLHGDPTKADSYGKFDLNNSHILPALLSKFHEAKTSNAPEVEVLGTGKALREFLYVDDMVNACVYLMENYSGG